MAEILAIMIFWIFLFSIGVFFVMKSDRLGNRTLYLVLGTILLLVNSFFSLSINFSNQAVNWVMIGLNIIFFIIGLVESLYEMIQIFKRKGVAI